MRFFAGALALTLAACEDASSDADRATFVPETLSATGWGPYGVGVRTIYFTDDRGKDQVLEVWYPAEVPSGELPESYPPTILTLNGHRYVPTNLQSAPYPLIGFSHGYQGIRFQSVYLTERLASHGFVVVAPDHVRNTFLDHDDAAVTDVLVERPGDIITAVDYLFSEAADPESWAAGLVADGAWISMGHSFGSWTSLVLAGARIDYQGVADFCDDASTTACRVAANRDPDEVQALMDAVQTADDRVVAAVPMSPGFWYSFGPNGEGLAEAAPALFLAGHRDQVFRYTTDARPTWSYHGGDALLATFYDTGHFAYSNLCDLAPFLSSECDGEDAGYVEMAVAQEASVVLTIAWLREQLGFGTEEDRYHLDPDTWDPAFIELEQR